MSAEIDYGVNEHGEVTATVRITGAHDLYRYAFAMAHAQCDFADAARGMFRFMKAAIPDALVYLDESLGGGFVDRTRSDRAGSCRYSVVTAKRAYRCHADSCGDVIPVGARHLKVTLMPDGEFHQGSSPIHLRECLGHYPTSDRVREALGAAAVADARRAAKRTARP